MFTLTALVAAWFAFYFVAKLAKLDERGVVLHPLYALFRSTRLNDFIIRLAGWRPGFWRVLGNIGVTASVGQALFVSWVLFKNLWNFIYVPEQASPVQPLIPGVTISVNSMPWFLAAAGVVILVHELSHGVQCVSGGVPIKNSAFMLAVITFGGAVEPDEEAMEKADFMTKMRIYASGSLVNLVMGLLTIPLFIFLGRSMPIPLVVFLNWLRFISINLALMNMLPIGPLDGGQMWREYTETLGSGQLLQTAATYGFIALLLGNIGLSLARFGFIPI
jgi:membrane-associated protease RseP (regulator of RpoE activity)